MTIGRDFVEQPRTNVSTGTFPINKIKRIWPLFYFFIPVLVAFNVNLIAPLTDNFHEGEYLCNLTNIIGYFGGQQSFPAFIHGPMDYVPSLAASVIRDGGHIIVWTRFFNVMTVMIGWIAWMDLPKIILRRHAHRYVWGIFFLILFLWMAIATGDDPVRKQQAFIGTRDVFFVTSVWAAVRAVLCNTPTAKYSLFVFSGALAAASFYWSYDRGVISIFWTATLMLTFIITKRIMAAITNFVGYVASMLLMSRIHVFGTMAENGRNILYLIQSNRDVWHMSLKVKELALPFIIGAFLWALFVILHALISISHESKGDIAPVILGLISVQFLFLVKLYEVPAYPTSYYTIWPSFLIFILSPPESAALNIVNHTICECWKNACTVWHNSHTLERRISVAVVLALVLILLSNCMVSCLVVMRQLVAPLADTAMVNAKQFDIEYLKGQNAPCIFQWSNEGVFTFLTRRPYCTLYPYAVYISRANEPLVLQQLRHMPPQLIIYNSPSWSMNIWGRSMRERLPAIDAYIRENYTFHESGAGYVFAIPKTK